MARHYANRAWDEYVAAEIFPGDGDASDAAVQALIEISGLIRALPPRTGSHAADCINRSYLQAAQASLGCGVGGRPRRIGTAFARVPVSTGQPARSALERRLPLRTSRRTLMALGAVAGAVAAFPARAETSLERIRRTGTVTVGTEAAYPPFEFVKDGKIVGYGSDLLAEVVKALGVKVVQLDLPWQGILPGLLAGKFDFVATTVAINAERAKRYAYTLPIAKGMPYLLKRKGDPMTKAADLNGKVVATQLTSSTEPVAKALDAKLKADGGPGFKDLRLFTAFPDCYVALASGQVDALMQSLPSLSVLVKERPETFALLAPAFADAPPSYLAWVTRPDETDLRDFISGVFRRLRDDGTMGKLQKKWLGLMMKIPDSGYLPEGAV